MTNLRDWAKDLKRHTLIIYFAARDPRTPWPIRLLAVGVAAYILCPIDLIPDFIPVLGYLDDLLLVPLGLMVVMRFLPLEVKQSAQQQAASLTRRPVNRSMIAVIVLVWVVSLGMFGNWIWRLLGA